MRHATSLLPCGRYGSHASTSHPASRAIALMPGAAGHVSSIRYDSQVIDGLKLLVVICCPRATVQRYQGLPISVSGPYASHVFVSRAPPAQNDCARRSNYCPALVAPRTWSSGRDDRLYDHGRWCQIRPGIRHSSKCWRDSRSFLCDRRVGAPGQLRSASGMLNRHGHIRTRLRSTREAN